jgi:NADPH-dependent glutamate synthase beta subunit-like oxidoreductase
MTTPEGEEKVATGKGEDPLPGYAECHFCTVAKKRRSWRCVRCLGRFSLRDRIVRAAEEKIRRPLASVMSFFLPGLGHFYRSSPGTGIFFFFIMAVVVAYFVFVEGEMTSGRWSLVGVLILVHIAQAIDAGRGPGESLPPCQEGCPAALSCALYVGLTREGKFREALELVEVKCPFPGTVGRVCHHPCEKNCRRAEEGEAIAICALKHFLADNAAADAGSFYRSEAPPSELFPEKIAVVGGGPSGLSAALYLRIMGFQVTVFEAEKELGGMPGSVIPDYRLPGWVYREEVERILALGVEVRTETALGRDFELGGLKEMGFSAAYLALGAQRSVRLPHCGAEEEGFLDGLEFLKQSKAGLGKKLHGDVLVIGGGNVAVDVAKTAVRLGGERVRKIFLETREAMPAHTWECEEAVEEGVELVPASAAVSFETKEGRVAAALCRRVERIDVDEHGRLRPVLQEGSDFTLEADWVITAVGTSPDYELFSGRPKLKEIRRGVRAGRLSPSLAPGFPVVVGGDYFAGPSSVIDAIAAGYEGSLELYRRLGKFSFFRLPTWKRLRPVKYPAYVDGPDKYRRKEMEKVDPEIRCESFCEICEVYGPEKAREEASRCLRCTWPMEPLKRPRRRSAPVLPPREEGPKGKEFI